MAKHSHLQMSRRERQVMEILYKRGRASAAEVREAMPDPPSYSAVRALLRLLEEKGHLRHKQEGKKYIFMPVVSKRRALRSALQNLLHTFFDGSVERAVASLLDMNVRDLSDEDLERLKRVVEQAKKEG